MKTYLVGGFVRDTLMGIEPKDKDYVVVGSTPDEMLSLGFTQVGCDFPVFLHPETGDEYALARTERKNGKGYQGFDCYFGTDVTLEDDLSRRDLTVNALAMGDDGNIYDYHGGRLDIKHKKLRMVNQHFADDPLRALRVCRFMARFGSKWTVTHDTLDMMKKVLVRDGEWKNLTKERVWKEMSRALMENHPWLFFQYLIKTLGIYVPNDMFDILADCLGISAASDFSLDERFVITANIVPPSVIPWGVIPNDCVKLFDSVERWSSGVVYSEANNVMRTLERLDFFRRPELLHKFLLCDRTLNHVDKKVSDVYDRWDLVIRKLDNTSIQSCIDKKLKGCVMGNCIREVRLNAISEVLEECNSG